MATKYGFKPVRSLSGTEIRANRYQLDTDSDRIYAGDLVVLNADGYVVRASSSTTGAGPFLGVALEPSASDPANGDNLLICDDPNAIFEAASTSAVARSAFNLNYKAVIQDGDSTQRISQCRIGAASTSSDGVKVIGIAEKPGNNSSTAGQVLLCTINNHYLKGGTGTAGV